MKGEATRGETRVAAKDRVDPECKIEELENCKIVYGVLPFRDLLSLLDFIGSGSIIDTGIAKRFDATMVVGLPEHVARLRAGKHGSSGELS